jgi:hypothetical protein
MLHFTSPPSHGSAAPWLSERPVCIFHHARCASIFRDSSSRQYPYNCLAVGQPSERNQLVMHQSALARQYMVFLIDIVLTLPHLLDHGNNSLSSSSPMNGQPFIRGSFDIPQSVPNKLTYAHGTMSVFGRHPCVLFGNVRYDRSAGIRLLVFMSPSGLTYVPGGVFFVK